MVPIAFAVLLAFILNPVVMLLAQRGVPRHPAVVTVVTATMVLAGVCGWIMASQLLQFANQLPEYEGNVSRRINELRSSSRHSVLTRIEEFGDKVTTAINGAAEKTVKDHVEPQAVRVVNQEGTMQFGPIITTVDVVFEFLASLALVIVLVIYMLINREKLRNRFLWLFGEGHMTVTTRALDDGAQGLERVSVDAAFGQRIVRPGGRLWALADRHAISPLVGRAVDFLGDIPLVGPWIAMFFPLVLSLAIMPGWTKPALIVALYVGYELAANLVLEPLLYGHSMGVSPAALLVAIAFWSWLWGAAGLVLSVPLTVCLVVMGKHFQSLAFLDILLGDEAVLTPELQLYQRLLAHDQDEAFEIVREQLQRATLGAVFDEVMIPALASARSDFESGLISENEAASIFEMVREIVEELGSVPGDFDQAAAAEPATGHATIKILACAARDAADEVGIEMFCRLLDPRVCAAEVLSTDHLVSEIVTRVGDGHPAIVCIGSLPPGGLSHTRLICKRLRTNFADLKIVVGRWGLPTDSEKGNREQLLEAGTDQFGTSMRETAVQLVQLQQLLQSVAGSEGSRHPIATADGPLASTRTSA